ncbi:MCE family protein [Rhodobacteraceae bacterium CCMM004]|nr:MCE family protein [Rhodobacteraceae bacterium CCMM004]
MTETPPPPDVMPARRSLWERVSIVWVVPLAALLISLGVVWQGYVDRGPLIEIHFENASGVHADETELRYRDVTVGLVERVRFSDNLAEVVVEVRLDKDVAPYVDAESQFWVVRPQVTAQGVTGLDTVLSGVFVAGSWDTEIGAPTSVFDGAESPPLIRNQENGLTIELTAPTVSGMADGTPILYRGIEVGTVANLRLSEDGQMVVADGFIPAPVDRLINVSTRFWDTSGFSFSFGAQGARLDVSSLASLVSGGISFDTAVPNDAAVDTGHRFLLYEDEGTARSSVFAPVPAGTTVTLSLIFDEPVRGLEPQSPVTFQGIEVGEVEALTGFVDAELFGDSRARLLATILLRPARMGLADDTDTAALVDFLDERVQNGLRAQLQAASILGGLRIALIEVADAAPAALDRDAEPYPVLPTIPGDVSDFADTAEGVFNRINALPVEELLQSAIDVMDSANRVLNDPALTDTPGEVVGLLADVRAIVGSDGVQRLPEDAAALMGSLTAAAEDLETLLQQAEEQGAVASLVAALDAAEAAANTVSESVAGFPAVLAEIEAATLTVDAFVQDLDALPLEPLTVQASTILGEVEALLLDPATQSLPGEVAATVEEARAAIADLRESGLFDSAVAAVNRASGAVDEVLALLQPLADEAQAAMTDLRGATEGLPGLVARAETLAADVSGLIATVEALPLSDVAARTLALLDGAEVLISGAETQALPGTVGAAVDEVRGLVADVRQSGLLDSAELTLASARQVLDDLSAGLDPVLAEAQATLGAVSQATAGLPDLIAQAEDITDGIDTLLASANAVPLADLAARAEGLIAAAEVLLAAPETQGLPGDLSAALEEARALVAEVRQSGLIDNADLTLTTARQTLNDLSAGLDPVLAEAEVALAGVSGAAADVPQVVARIQEVADGIDTLVATANGLPLSDVVARAEGLIAAAETLIAAPEAQALPAELGEALDALTALVAEIRSSGVIDGAADTLGAAETAVAEISAALRPVLEEARAAAAAVREASDGVPRIVARAEAIAADLERLSQTAADLPLDELTAQVRSVLDGAEALIASDEIQSVPPALRSALGQVETLLAEIRASGMVANANATFSATTRAADAIAEASDDLPGLVRRMNGLLGEAETVIRGFRADGPLGSDARSALRDIREAARSVNSLARAIERNPNSLLLGR